MNQRSFGSGIPHFGDARSREGWLEVLKRVKAGEMPPKSKPQMPEKERDALLDWIGAGIKAADIRRAAEGRVVLRRLNRVEYENTVRDLFSVDVMVKELDDRDAVTLTGAEVA